MDCRFVIVVAAATILVVDSSLCCFECWDANSNNKQPEFIRFMCKSPPQL